MLKSVSIFSLLSLMIMLSAFSYCPTGIAESESSLTSNGQLQEPKKEEKSNSSSQTSTETTDATGSLVNNAAVAVSDVITTKPVEKQEAGNRDDDNRNNNRKSVAFTDIQSVDQRPTQTDSKIMHTGKCKGGVIIGNHNTILRGDGNRCTCFFVIGDGNVVPRGSKVINNITTGTINKLKMGLQHVPGYLYKRSN